MEFQTIAQPRLGALEAGQDACGVPSRLKNEFGDEVPASNQLELRQFFPFAQRAWKAGCYLPHGISSQQGPPWLTGVQLEHQVIFFKQLAQRV